MPSASPSYLVLGAGCFGASTAWHLKRLKPDSKVILVDRAPFPSPTAAGHDLNKIVRAEYEDHIYMKLALEAFQAWKTDPIFSQWYNETGIVFAATKAPGRAMIDNYNLITGSSPAVLIDPDDARSRFGGIFKDANWRGVQKCTWNPQAGWTDSAGALKSVVQAAVDLGVEYISATISHLSFSDTGRCTGVVVDDGMTLEAQNIVVCTGAHTPKLFADSAPDRPEFQVGDRMIAAAAIMGAFRVPKDQMEKFSTAPIIVNPTGHMPGESIPAGPRGLVKCTHELSFTNKTLHKKSNQLISIPPERESQQTWSLDVPQKLKEETHAVQEKLYGKWIQGLEPEYYRMCWDSITPNQDFIISPHAKSENLYIVAGGSFHGWKFIPTIGKYVVQMLDGELSPELAKKWAWDRSTEGDACGVYAPTRDLNDLQ